MTDAEVPNAEDPNAEDLLPVPPDDDVAAALVATFSSARYVRSHGQPVVFVARADWYDVAAFLRDSHEFTMCMDVTAVDHLLGPDRLVVDGVELERFEVVANFLSHVRNRRMRVVTQVSAHDPTVASLTGLYPGANFAEREVYDLFGINFEGHPDLVRILMPDDWVGHPLRKDSAGARVPVTFKGSPGPR